MVGRARHALGGHALLAAIIVAGAALRVRLYLIDRSLWTDEAALARNILGRSFAGLARPLDWAQVAPAGFLWLEKLATVLAGPGELALRAVPLVAGIATLAMFAAVARRLLTPAVAAFALVIVAFSPPLLYFSAEVKPYALDAAVSTGIVWLALEAGRAPITARRTALALAGALAPWLSQPAVFGLGAAAAFVAWPALRARRWGALRGVAPVLACWAVGAGSAVWWALHVVPRAAHDYLVSFWNADFPPIASGAVAVAAWTGRAVAGIFAFQIPAPLAWIALGLAALGLMQLGRRVAGGVLLVAGPAMLVLAASALRLYPLAGRLSLFLAPVVALAIGGGLEWLAEHAAGHPASRGAVAALAATCVALSAASVRYVPTTREELRPVIRYVAAHRRPGDAIYVYYGAEQAFRYYAPRFGLTSAAYQVGHCARDDWRAYTAELDALRGHPRVWLVLAHPFSRAGIDEQRLFLGYLAHLGRRVGGFSAPGAIAALYDLGDSTRAARGPAGYVPPASGDTTGVRERCFGVVAAR